MKKLYLLFAIACLTTFAIAQEKEKYELGKPNNDAYRYLDDYQALKNYIDYEKYPNFKLGIGIIESSYLSTSSSLVKNLVIFIFNVIFCIHIQIDFIIYEGKRSCI